MRIGTFIAAGLVGVLAFGSAANAQAQALADSPLAARLDGLAAGFMATEQVPGAIAAVVVGDAAILRGWGSVDLEAGTPAGPDDARFEIGSISKLFTWVLVMMLVEEGRLDLQADVSGYLRATVVPGAEPLTLAQLMSHRPGFEESYALFDPAVGALPRPQALAASAPAQVFPRGQVTAYSNWGVALAGQIVEDVAGAPYAEVLRTRPRAEWLAALEAAGVPCAPVNDIGELAASAQFAAVDIVQTLPESGVRVVGLPISFNRQRPRSTRPSPRAGQHTRDILGR